MTHEEAREQVERLLERKCRVPGYEHDHYCPNCDNSIIIPAEALRLLLTPPTCATCQYQVARDRNCQMLILPPHIEIPMMEKAGGSVPRPGDKRFSCTLHTPKAAPDAV
jgi:predicted RNA-binding Zn-ribbon protein involved in translation (DUF1610 family)